MIKHMNEAIECPKCSFDMVHPVAVCVIVDRDRYTITSAGLEHEEVYRGSSANGVIIYREFLGECGHRWRIVEEFNQGGTYTETVILPHQIGPMSTIWRN